MKIKLIRQVFTDKSTIGSLYLNDVFECFIIEDKDRGLTDAMTLAEINAKKVYGLTCIPYGMYKVIVSKSNRFSLKAGKDVFLPLLTNVKGYEGIRIHKGNTAADSLGCLLPGKVKGVDKVSNSTDAFNQLDAKINAAIKAGEQVTIEIVK